MSAKVRLRSLVILVSAAIAVLAGCDSGSSANKPASPAPPASPKVALPPTLFAATAPADAKAVGASKPTAKKGEQVVLTGRIGGSSEPFVAERAIFTLVDLSLASCAAMGDKDHCATPWDYCCEAPESLTKNTATIRVVDATGAPLKLNLNGAGDLKPLAEITVAGTIAEADGKNLLIVNAERIYVKK